MVRWDPHNYKGLSLLGKGLAAGGVIMCLNVSMMMEMCVRFCVFQTVKYEHQRISVSTDNYILDWQNLDVRWGV